MRTSASLVSMLQESHAALVASNEHHRTEIEELKLAHALEVAAFEANFDELAAELAQLRNVAMLPPQRSANDGEVVVHLSEARAVDDEKGSWRASRAASIATRSKDEGAKEERATRANPGKAIKEEAAKEERSARAIPVKVIKEATKDERTARGNPGKAPKEEAPKEERVASKRVAGAQRGLHPITTCTSATRPRDTSAGGKEN